LLSELGIPEASLNTAAGVHEQYLAAKSLWGKARAYLTLFRNDPRRIRRLTVALAVLLIPPAVALALPAAYEALRSERLYRIGAFLSYALTLTLTFWKNVEPYWQQFRKGLSVLESKEQEIDAERRKRVSELEQDVSELTKQYLEAEREAESINREVKHLEQEIAGTNSGRILADFIEDRAACNDYRRHLGVLALIRRDFEKLADLFRQQRQEDLAGQSRPGQHTINRIILYIDDLDRCPPDRVVQVLQAIHLLLAFPLFVVVVGVDARWVTRSLQESYEWLRADAGGEGEDGAPSPGEPRAATPHDYLEKIFQIPFWLNPLGDAACKEFLDGLTRDSLEDAGRNGDSSRLPPEEGAHVEADANALKATPNAEAEGRAVADVTDAAGSGGAAEGGDEGGELDPASVTPQNVSGSVPDGGPGGEEGEAAGEEEGDDAEKIDLEPQNLKLTGAEVGYMKELTPLVGRSPRSVKRFLNCYRLIKVGLRPEQLQRFVGGDGRGGEFRAVMILLAVITGAPSVSIHVIEELEERRRLGARGGTLHDLLEALARRPEVESSPEWGRVRRFLEGHVAQKESAAVLQSLLDIVPRVARYSFRVSKFEAAPAAPRAGGRPEGAGLKTTTPRSRAGA
jgi:KAP family P-loop domain